MMIVVYYKITLNYYNENLFKVEILSDTKTIQIKNGEITSIKVILKNKTRKIISSENDIFLSYHITDKNSNIVQYENLRAIIDPINPFGISNPINLEISPELDPGEYLLQVDIVQEYVTWFSDKGNEVYTTELIIN